jgi:hypothetical protein
VVAPAGPAPMRTASQGASLEGGDESIMAISLRLNGPHSSKWGVSYTGEATLVREECAAYQQAS